VKSTLTSVRLDKLTLHLGHFALIVDSVLETKVELLLLEIRETFVNHPGVGVDDAVERKAGSLDWVFVHFCLLIIILANLNRVSGGQL
jgi:hypothetical protein